MEITARAANEWSTDHTRALKFLFVRVPVECPDATAVNLNSGRYFLTMAAWPGDCLPSGWSIGCVIGCAEDSPHAATRQVFGWAIVVLQVAALRRDSRPRPRTNYFNNFAREV